MKLFIFLLTSLFFFSSCENQKNKSVVKKVQEIIQNKEIPIIKEPLNSVDICKKQLITNGFYKQLKLNQPTAITFFKLRENLEKFGDRPETRDSLLKPLQKRDRQAIYQTTDGYAIYKTNLLPFFKKENINIISSNQLTKDSTLFSQTDTIILNPSYFLNKDGVILFKPNKEPIVWQYDFKEEYCPVELLLEMYFKK